MNKMILPLLIIFACCITVFSQQFEYGKTSDLKGLTKIFLDTGADMETRNRIIENIEKAKLGVEFLGSMDDAQIVMTFRDETNEVITGVNTNVTTNPYGGTANTTAVRVPLINGAGNVFVANKDGTNPKLVLSVTNSQQSRWEKRPSTKFANAFIKAYKEANGIK